MSAIDEVIAFARDYVNHPSTRSKVRKAKISQALYDLTGKKLGTNCGTCYIEAIFKILNVTKMANYELRQGYIAQFSGQGFRGVKAFSNLNLKTDPAKYDLIAREYLRLYPERVRYFVKIPKLEPPKTVQPVVNIPKPEIRFSQPDPKSVFNDTVKTTADPVVTKPKSRSKKSAKKPE